MNKTLGKINKLLEILVMANLATMTFLVFLNVVLRYAMNSGITLSEELSRILFVWLTFMGAVLALGGNDHVAMNLFVEKLPARLRAYWPLMIDAVLLVLSVLLVIGCGQLMMQNMSNKMPISGIPTGINYLAAFLMALLFCLTLVSRMVVRFFALNRGDAA
ncbi:MAG: TRAP transporter small permease [Cardiobacteriaceae bacterium]|nr:TRAP transporter small permease [Cardiobacteriaceae bacterium]